jgi:hypothetical protein
MAEKKKAVSCEYCGGPTRGEAHHEQIRECVRFLAKVVGTLPPEHLGKKVEA